MSGSIQVRTNTLMGSSSMVEHLFLVQKVVGSSPTFPAKKVVDKLNES